VRPATAAVSAAALAAQPQGILPPAGAPYFDEIRGASDDILGIKALYELNIVQTAAVGETEETVKNISEILRHLWLTNVGTEDEPIIAIRSDLGIYSDSFLTAGGAFPGEEGSSGGVTEIPIASDTVLGGIRTGYTEALVESNLCLAVCVTEDGKAYVQVPMGASDSVVAPGNHTHTGYAATSHNHSADQITSGTLALPRIPTGTTSTTVALGDHTHSQYMLTASFSAQAIVEKLGTTPVNRATGDADGNTISSSYLKLSGGTLTGDLTAQNITPAANATYNLGTKVKCWKHGYLTRWYPKPNDETVYIEFDTTKSAFKIVGNIYSTGAITAGA